MINELRCRSLCLCLFAHQNSALCFSTPKPPFCCLKLPFGSVNLELRCEGWWKHGFASQRRYICMIACCTKDPLCVRIHLRYIFLPKISVSEPFLVMNFGIITIFGRNFGIIAIFGRNFSSIINFGRNFGWKNKFGYALTIMQIEYSVSGYKKGLLPLLFR